MQPTPQWWGDPNRSRPVGGEEYSQVKPSEPRPDPGSSIDHGQRRSKVVIDLDAQVPGSRCRGG